MATETASEKVYLVSLLLGASLLLFLGRNLLAESAALTWVLTLASTTAVAVSFLLLYHIREELHLNRRELAHKEAELQVAQEVQEALFPKQLPTDHGMELTGLCIPAREVGGDYFDVVATPEGRLVLVIADTSGKGVSAALLMSNLQALLRTEASAERSPASVCAKLNEHFFAVTDASRFATLFYGEWTPARRSFRYVNAGHCPPLLFGSFQDYPFDQGGLPLGIRSGTSFQMGEIVLQAGDTLLLYSDGVTEAVSQQGEEFGSARLAATVERHLFLPLGQLQQKILEEVRGFSAGEPRDDLTLLLARVVP